ncbi:sensor histidine kinase [Cytobacillus sp. FJAT-54145]|uniref:histidine kinase n=1 Tax=Cytobacillus spartinae TaxID=3299023 RepID=A0ABW6K7X9_9BACI
MMLPFYVRLFLVFIIWLFIISGPKGDPGTSILFYCSFYIAIYFLMPIMKSKLLGNLILITTPFLYVTMIDSSLFYYLLLIVLFSIYESAYFIEPKLYRFLAAVFVGFSFITYFIVGSDQLNIISISIFYILILTISLLFLNSYFFLVKEKSDLYEQVLEEYRNVKRQSLKNEKVVRTEERTRIAREMHDSVGHKLTALSIHLEMLLIEKKNETFQNMKETVDECLEETRRAVRALKSEDIEGIASVIQLIRKLESESHMRVNFTTKQGVLGANLSNQNSVVLYRVLQESLTNAMKYGHSREVIVTLGISAIGELLFTVKNAYHHSSQQIHEGFGLKNMRLRVKEVGGRLEIYQSDDSFVIEGYIPLEEGKKSD